MKRRLETVLLVLCTVHPLTLAGLFAIVLTQPFTDAYGLWALPGLLLNLLPELYLLTLPIGLFGLFVGRRSLAISAAFVASTGMWLFVPYFTSSPLQPPTETPTISVMTFNTLGNIDAVKAAVQRHPTDIVLLQESPDEGTLAAAALGYSHIWHAGDANGNAVLSAYPLLEQTTFDLGGGWLAQRGVVEIEGQKLAFYNVHLLLPLNLRPVESTLAQLLSGRYDERTRNAQVRALLDRLRLEPHPYVVAGDFNMTEYSPIYNELAAVMQDSFRTVERGFGLTWPAPLPLARIDYLWYGGGLEAVTSRRGPKTPSDHLPLISSFKLTGNEQFESTSE